MSKFSRPNKKKPNSGFEKDALLCCSRNHGLFIYVRFEAVEAAHAVP
jgi:hypothetical protein